ncbi:MAG: hypothetical protein HQ559_01635 [Lentisphaerae bacterium]|nr:hypothetical protein [Lentisphaerota bacterium]
MRTTELASQIILSDATPGQKSEMLRALDRIATDHLGIVTAEAARTGRYLTRIRRILDDKGNWHDKLFVVRRAVS